MKHSKSLPYDSILCPSAQIAWRETFPTSIQFGDIYYSSVDGLLESEYVFLRGNQLPDRWNGADSFTIAELGFGTGLNFFATWQMWQQQPRRGFLHYLSVEAFPVAIADIERAISHWPQLRSQMELFKKQYPLPLCGIHRLCFFHEKIILTLLFGKAEELLPQVCAEVNAWYLDGFAPAKNPELWDGRLLQELGRLSAPDATVATFSAARAMRESLITAGFEIVKCSGFGKKRDMLTGVFVAKQAESRHRNVKKVAVLGSGMAGAQVACALASRGIEVTVFEKMHASSQGASGNPAGMLMPFLAAVPDFHTRFSVLAHQFARTQLERLQTTAALWNPCGVLRLTTSKRLKKLYEVLEKQTALHCLAIPLSASEVSARTGLMGIDSAAIFFATGGVASPAKLCTSLLEQDGISLELCSEICDLRQNGQCWQLSTDSLGEVHFDAVVIATGVEASSFKVCNWLPLESVRGQIAYLCELPQTKRLQTALCFDGYLLPAEEGVQVVGATFEHESFSTAVEVAQETAVLSRLREYLPMLPADLKTLGGRVGFRATTPDRLPVVGAIPRAAEFKMAYRPRLYREQWLDYQSEQFYPGLYITTGHGSQGLTSAPIAAELIASMVCNEPLPLDKELVDLLNPVRFLVRDLNRL